MSEKSTSIVNTTAEFTKYSHISLAELQQFCDATLGWPRDTPVRITTFDGQRDGYSITIRATLGGAS